MNKTKYYYSEAVHLRYLPCYTDAEGTPLFIDHTKNPIVKNVPRVTVASVLDSENNVLSFGVSVCSEKDVFSKEIGRGLALDRALNNPCLKVAVLKKTKISELSKKYADELIEQHLHV